VIKKALDRIKDDENIAVKSLLIICSVLYLCLAPFSKHGDFWILNYKAKFFATYGFDYINHITINYPSLFLPIQGMWLKIGSAIYGYNLNEWVWEQGMPDTSMLPFWAMITYLFCLVLMAIISYRILKNKWLSVLCFGSFSFISVIVMGQIDVFCTLFMYLAMVCFIRSLESNSYVRWMIASFACIGVSIMFVPFAGLLFPVFILFSVNLLIRKGWNYMRIGLVVTTGMAITGILSVILWIFQAWYFIPAMTNGESGWLLNLVLAPANLPPYHNIALWLLGYTIIIYFVFREFILKNNVKRSTEQSFIFYNFVVMAWLFISTYTHPQWWILLVPPMLFVLDRFQNKVYYLFCLVLSTLYIFYPMMWANNIDQLLTDYLPVITIAGNSATILFTLLAAVLVLWIMELVYDLRTETGDTNVITNHVRAKMIDKWGPPVILIAPFIAAAIAGGLLWLL